MFNATVMGVWSWFIDSWTIDWVTLLCGRGLDIVAAYTIITAQTLMCRPSLFMSKLIFSFWETQFGQKNDHVFWFYYSAAWILAGNKQFYHKLRTAFPFEAVTAIKLSAYDWTSHTSTKENNIQWTAIISQRVHYAPRTPQALSLLCFGSDEDYHYAISVGRQAHDPQRCCGHINVLNWKQHLEGVHKGWLDSQLPGAETSWGSVGAMHMKTQFKADSLCAEHTEMKLFSALTLR